MIGEVLEFSQDAARATAAHTMTSSKTVLLIDDNPHLLVDLTEILSIEGYTVIQATSGQEGLARLHAADRVDVIVCDYQMPGFDGEDVLHAVRSSPQTAAIPFILISAADPAPVIAAPAEYRFIAKPLNLEALLALLAES
ncbi:MAG TPA: response regulator [Aggregatilineales bacterium]|jgi:CheY-like chemotaxis protein|nr:response regulator [Aggregatilineales bacterium]